MGQTASYKLPYPELTDTADVPRDVKALADAADLILKPLLHTEFTAPVSVTSTDAALPTNIVTGPSVNFDGAPVLAEFLAPYLHTPAAGGLLVIYLYVDGVSSGRIALAGGVAGMYVPALARRRLTPSAGAHVLKIGAIQTYGDAIVGAGAGGANAYVPGYLRVTRA